MKKLFTLLVISLISLNIYSQQLTDSLIVFYNFQGNTKDNSGNNLDATLSGPTLTTDRSGYANSAYAFDGVDDNITFPSSSKMKPTFPITVSFWVKSEKATGTNPVFGNNYLNNKYNGITLNLGADGNVAIGFGDGNGAGPSNRHGKTSSSKITKSKWHHIVGIWRGVNDLDIYIDSVNAGGTYAGTAKSMAYTNDPGKIGNFENYGVALNYFQGSIDKFAMWHRALSKSEVKVLYESYLSVKQIPNSQNLKIMPNPANNQFTISTNNSVYGMDYTLSDLAGKVLIKGTINSDSTQVDISNISTGMYILQVGDQSYKVVKN